jgi:putative transposase
LRRPPISLWEHRLALKRLREEGRSQIDEAAIFRAIETMRQIANQAVVETKTARRQRERRLRLIQGGKTDVPYIPADQPSEVPTDEEEYSKLDILPFEEWS